MKVVLFGATGMIGSAALLECLDHPDVDEVVTLVRRPTGHAHPKLAEVVHGDMLDLGPVADRLRDAKACLYCLGISVAGLTEDEYRRVTVDMPLEATRVLLDVAPDCAFVHVSGLGADASEEGRVMWARVKGEAENALQRLPFRSVAVVRPAFVQPTRGVTSRTTMYRLFYAVLAPLTPVLRRITPAYVTTSDRVGLALIAAGREGVSGVLENRDIDALAERERERLER